MKKFYSPLKALFFLLLGLVSIFLVKVLFFDTVSFSTNVFSTISNDYLFTDKNAKSKDVLIEKIKILQEVIPAAKEASLKNISFDKNSKNSDKKVMQELKIQSEKISKESVGEREISNIIQNTEIALDTTLSPAVSTVLVSNTANVSVSDFVKKIEALSITKKLLSQEKNSEILSEKLKSLEALIAKNYQSSEVVSTEHLHNAIESKLAPPKTVSEKVDGVITSVKNSFSNAEIVETKDFTPQKTFNSFSNSVKEKIEKVQETKEKIKVNVESVKEGVSDASVSFDKVQEGFSGVTDAFKKIRESFQKMFENL